MLSDPFQPDVEELTNTINRKGRVYNVLMERWNDVIMQGSKTERTDKHPFDLLRVTVTDEKGKAVYRRPLWLMIAGAKRRQITSKEAYLSYGRRYDIEHFFRFGKQRLGLINSQTCETRHEENWHWIGLLAYNMLYHARQLTKSVYHPWEKYKARIVANAQRPSQVQRDYGRIIREIGTPAPVPKPRGKSAGRQLGCEIGERVDQPIIIKSKNEENLEFLDQIPTKDKKQKRVSPKKAAHRSSKAVKIPYKRLRRVWDKNRPPPIRC